jgi:hypothetical protein
LLVGCVEYAITPSALVREFRVVGPNGRAYDKPKEKKQKTT